MSGKGISGALTLPVGRPGRMLASAITVIGLALIWFAAISPVIGWYQSRAALLARQQDIAVHMAALAQEIPQLRAAVTAARPLSQTQQILLAGGTDAIASANLQSALQNLAQQAGASLASSEVLPVQQQGALRRVGIQVSVTATWPVLIGLLQAISTARPRMVVGQFGIMSSSQSDSGDQPLQADFSVSAFTSAAP